LPTVDVAWIVENRRRFNAHEVGSLVPVVFARYARLLHPAWAASDRRDTPVRWDAVAAWSGRTMHALAQWESLSAPATDVDRRPPFIAPPDAGGLPSASLSALLNVLAAHTSTPDEFFIGVWEGYGWPVAAWAGPEVLELENRTYLIRRGPLALAREIGWQPAPDRLHVEPPNLLWPADRAWFVASDKRSRLDLPRRISPLVHGLLAHAGLEVWPIAATDLIPIESDHVNGG
jgi:hypothetical protein